LIIKNAEDLLTQVDKLKSQRKKIGAISGSFDGYHKGHRYALRYCSERVDFLFVLINSDQSVKTYKGNQRPFNDLDKRIKSIDNDFKNLYLYSFDELIPNNTLEIIRPNFYFLTNEWIKNPVEDVVLKRFGTKIVKHPLLQNISTTSILAHDESSKGAIFFDRDGTINEDVGYLNSIDNIKIQKDNLEALRKLSSLDFINIIISNQSGVGHKYFSISKLNEINNEILLRIEKSGGRINKIYFDTSTNDNPSKNRKPNIGMILNARKDFDISLKKSWVIGDKHTDIELGKKCNMKTIYIKNKKYKYRSPFKPDFTVSNLLETYDIIKN
tara:strand:+ start:6459 stop:7439 length:981 start_codon:yes stop_codon:yes gene_type:complete